MNIFSHIPGFGKKVDDEGNLTPEEQAAQDKADRIEWHRKNVRNGPVSFKSISAGQQRRAMKRAELAATRKNFKREVRDFHMKQRVAAVLRPHLQVLGLVPTATSRTFALQDEIVSTGWIVQRYGRETEYEGVKTGHVSFAREDVILAIRTAAKFYEAATGYVVTVPADFEPAIYAEAATA